MVNNLGDNLLEVNEVARLLKLDVNTIIRWSQIGILKSCGVGNDGTSLFRRSDLVGFLTREEDDRIKRTRGISHPPEN